MYMYVIKASLSPEILAQNVLQSGFRDVFSVKVSKYDTKDTLLLVQQIVAKCDIGNMNFESVKKVTTLRIRI